MKALVISDSHGRLDGAREAVSRLLGKIECVIHLGDMAADAKALSPLYDIPFHYVGGNCDLYFSVEMFPESKIIELNGVKLLLAHGHTDGVRSGYVRLAARAKKEGAAVALCGHTHEPFNNVIDGVLVVNPGSVSFPRGRARFPSYAVLDLTDGVRAGIVELRPKGAIQAHRR